MKVLVLDIGGSNVKLGLTGEKVGTKFATGPNYTPDRLLGDLAKATAGWDYDVVSVGFPGPVIDGRIPYEPLNLGDGWVNIRFDEALGRPVKLINDAAMQAVGCYAGGRLLFLSLGTGLGSALIVDFPSTDLCLPSWQRKQPSQSIWLR